ncbi:TonB-dependent receptor [Halioxenophilus aromaticivorans]|uniref:TonB-dependent receptor n=1 Tax=Halioxenophilus aromaticivorans TaxID=1306992 RepID=A0AAV3U393_9ALTE
MKRTLFRDTNTLPLIPFPMTLASSLVIFFSQGLYAQEQSSGETDATMLEEIVVEGIRASLEAASDMKRDDSRIVDAIVAEDIGKLPDNNIAEALQRITGVSINSDFGVGDSVSIRGLSQNRVELNGRSTVGDERDGVSLQDFPSSFLKAVEVIKSPTADMIEGALGGTVSMKTVRPLDLDGFTAAGSLDGEYADKTENWAPIANISIGNLWDLGEAGTFGAIAMYSYQDREIRQDEYKNRVRLYDEDVNGLTANTPSGLFAVREQNTVEQYVENRERNALNISLQWAPTSERGNVYLDLSTTERSGSQNGSSILDVGGTRTYFDGTTQDGNGQVNNYALEGAFVIPKTWSDFRETDSFSHALGAEWDFTDSVTFSGEISMAASDSYRPDSEFNLRPVSRDDWEIWAEQYTPGTSDYDDDLSDFNLRHTIDATFSQSGNSIPSIIYSDPNALTGADNLAIRAFYHDDIRTKNDEQAIRFDLDYKDAFNIDWLTSVKAGFRYTENDYEFTQKRFRADNLYRNVLTDEGTDNEAPIAVWIDDFENMFPGSFETINHANSFDQNGTSGQMDLLSYRIYRGDLLANPSATFDRIQQMLAGTNYALTGSLSDNLELQEGSYRDIAEQTTAFYISADMEFERLRATVGGRYVKTEIDSTVIVDSAPVSGSHSYNDFLPSVNITYDLSENTLLRFAGAKVMRRADYAELSPAFEVNSAITAATQGALDLDPYRATQFDLSLEHYFGQGNLVSLALFYKDVESFLSSTNTCVANQQTTDQNVTEWEGICLLENAGETNSDLVYSTLGDFAGAANADAAGFNYTAAQRDAGLTGIVTNRVTNGENGTVEGLEFGYQQHFDFLPGIFSGLGMSFNYTYSKSEQPNGNMLLDISENTYNLQVYWEYSDFQVRLAYNFRDQFLDTEEETRIQTIGGLALNSATNDESSELYDATAGNNYRDDRGQLDFSASWDATENLTVVANATNLTGEPSVYITELGSPWLYTEADRRFSLGLRASF